MHCGIEFVNLNESCVVENAGGGVTGENLQPHAINSLDKNKRTILDLSGMNISGAVFKFRT